MNLFEFCTTLGIKSYCGRYNGPDDLRDFKGVIHIPYAWSNFALFENMEKLNEVVASGGILPTVSAKQKQYEPEAQAETIFYEALQKVLTEEVLAKSQGQDASTKIKHLIQVVNFIKNPKVDLSKVESATLSKTFSTILFVSSLHKMIEDIVPD